MMVVVVVVLDRGFPKPLTLTHTHPTLQTHKSYLPTYLLFSQGEQYEAAGQRGIRWLVIVEERLLSSNGSVKIKSLDRKTEVMVQKSDVPKYLQVTTITITTTIICIIIIIIIIIIIMRVMLPYIN